MTATWTGPEKLPMTQPATARHAGARPQHGYRTLLAKTRAHQTMMDMAEISMIDSLMIAQSANDGRQGVHNGNAGDDEGHEHDHNTLRAHNARHRDDAHH